MQDSFHYRLAGKSNLEGSFCTITIERSRIELPASEPSFPMACSFQIDLRLKSSSQDPVFPSPEWC